MNSRSRVHKDSLGGRLVRWRLTLGVDQAAAAEMLGVTRRSYGKWERNEVEPAPEHADAIEAFLKTAEGEDPPEKGRGSNGQSG